MAIRCRTFSLAASAGCGVGRQCTFARSHGDRSDSMVLNGMRSASSMTGRSGAKKGDSAAKYVGPSSRSHSACAASTGAAARQSDRPAWLRTGLLHKARSVERQRDFDLSGVCLDLNARFPPTNPGCIWRNNSRNAHINTAHCHFVVVRNKTWGARQVCPAPLLKIDWGRVQCGRGGGHNSLLLWWRLVMSAETYGPLPNAPDGPVGRGFVVISASAGHGQSPSRAPTASSRWTTCTCRATGFPG